MRPVALGFILGVVVAVAVPLLAAWLGLVSMSAMGEPGTIERELGELAFDGWLSRSAPHERNPLPASAEVLASGLAHYRENCLGCHGAPGIERSEIGKGLHPSAPDLHVADAQALTDGELFWVAKNGVRMTGMPAFGRTHSDPELWRVVAFIRALTHLPPEQVAALRAPLAGEEHHHEEMHAPEGGEHEHPLAHPPPR